MTTRDFLKLPIADQLHHLAILNRDAYDKRYLWRRGLSRAAGTEAKKLAREAERLKSALRTKATEQARRERQDGSL